MTIQAESALQVEALSVSYQTRRVLWGIDFTIPKGVCAAIVGPNGAGKSTLLKSIMGLIPRSSGAVRFLGKDISAVRGLVSYVPQREEVDWDFPITVRDVVLMGRYGTQSRFWRTTKDDYAKVTKALEESGIAHLESRQIGELSGGQKQRVFIARALAQDATIYLLDEPFAGVDVATEKELAQMFKRLALQGKTIICVHHDLYSVAEYFEYVLLLNLRLVAAGDLKSVFNGENLQQTYGGKLGILAELAESIR